MDETVKDVVIVGAGGFCREVIWLAGECGNEWNVIGVLDDNPELKDKEICGVPVIGGIADCKEYLSAWFTVAVGAPRVRRDIVKKLSGQGVKNYATLVHPKTGMSKYVFFGEGTIVTAGCILTTQITIGKHNIINLASTIGHDVSSGDYCTIAPQVAVSGNVKMGDCVELGTGAIIVQNLEIARGAMVGAGSIVTKNLKSDSLYVGIPAKRIRSLEEV